MNISKSEMLSLLTNCLSDYGWFRLHRAFIEKYGLEQAAIISFLINWFFIKTDNEGLTDDWFFCTVESMEENIHINVDKQRRMIKKLISEGILETKKMGLPARRHFRFNSENLYKILLDWRSRNPKKKKKRNDCTSSGSSDGTSTVTGSRTSTVTYKNSIDKNKNTKNSKTSSSHGRQATHRRKKPSLNGDWYAAQSEKLFRTLQKNNADLVNARNDKGHFSAHAKPHSFEDPLDQLVFTRGIEKSEIEKVLNYVDNHYGTNMYIPRIHKVMDLYNKWQRIADQYNKYQNSLVQDKSSPDYDSDKDPTLQVEDWVDQHYDDYDCDEGGCIEEDRILEACKALEIPRRLVNL